jgi:hypothetical protein
MLDGVDILAEEKVKAENLHGGDRKDRETIFMSLLPEEKFVDRRMHIIEDLPVESDDPESEDLGSFLQKRDDHPSSIIASEEPSNGSLARRYVGELI